MKLTKREREVLGRVCEGATSKVIAHEIGISEQAVKAHIGHLFAKFGVRNRAGLAAAAIAEGNVRRKAISDRYHERARALAREIEVLRLMNSSLRSRQSESRHTPTRSRSVRPGARRGRTRQARPPGR